MASKQILLEGIGPVSLHKRKGSSSIRLSINPKGQIRVTLPYWVPYEAGARFARSRRDWITEHSGHNGKLLANGQPVGMSHRLLFEVSPVAQRVSARVGGGIIRVTYLAGKQPDEPAVQSAAEKACIRALRNEAEALLPDRLRRLAGSHSFDYRSVQIKQLTGRWGSCDSQRNIVLNLFLMELPWTLIDYVLLHELTHTVIMRHGPDFWAAMKRVLPDVAVRRAAMKQRRPVAGTQPPG